MDEPEASAALANLRDWVADCRASVGNGVLCIKASEITMQAWEARCVTEH